MGEDVICVAQPITLSVPLGNLKETDLMAALEEVIEHWVYSVHNARMGDEFAMAETARAVTWLHSKYGLPTDGSEGR